ncbi:MAG: hypothetical protein QM770_19235 [Tepidisphaeraceae bacterium]
MNARRRSNAFRVAVDTLELRQLMAGEIDPIFADEYEPNNSFSAATNLGTTNSASLDLLTLHVSGTSGDNDYFKFIASSSGVVQARAYYSGSTGSRTIRAYDGAQTQVASDSRTGAGGVIGVAFGVTAGQTYYLRVNGVQTADYGLSLGPLSLNASFDWNMPKRFGTQLDAYGLPVIPNTRDYARPNPAILNGVEVPRFTVHMDALGYSANDGITYSWSYTNGPGGYATTSAGGSSNVDLPEGTYTATLTASAAGVSVSTSQTIAVRNFLIVAIGDSYGSGEGNPHSPQQYDWLGFTTSGAKWAQGATDAETAANRRAHRSSFAGSVQAALDLENGDAKTSVTFVFLNHTGATVPDLLTGPQASGDASDSSTDPAQIDQMTAIVGNRHIDGLVMSVGGNDAGFVPLVTRLLQAKPSARITPRSSPAFGTMPRLGETT